MDFIIEPYTGSHRDLDWSFREADDSEALLDSYIDLGQLWVARGAGGEVIGHLQVVPRDEEAWEVTNTAVVESRRGRGVGRALLERAVDDARAAGVRRHHPCDGSRRRRQPAVLPACGFRMTRVVQDVFTPANGYPPGLEVDGMPLLDQVWFERVL